MVVNDYKQSTVRFKKDGIKISAEEILYYTGLVLWLAQFYISRTIFSDFFGGKLITAVRYFCMLIFLIKIVISEEKIHMKAAAVIITAAAAFVVVQRHINTGMPLIQILLLIYAARDLSFKRICKVILWACLFLWLTPVFMDEVGLYEMQRNVYKDRVREYLNFTYMSYPAIYFNNIILCAMYAYTDPERRGSGGNYARRKTLSWPILILLEAVTVWLFVITDTSLPFVTGTIAIVLYSLFVKLRFFRIKNTLRTRVAGALMFPFFALVNILFVSNYSGKIKALRQIDKMTHSRISLANTGLKRYGVHLLGSQIVENTDTTKGGYFYIDSGYMKILINYGLIVFIMMIIMYSVITYAAIAEHDVVLVIWLFCLAFYSMLNNMLLSPTENGCLLALCYAIDLLKWRGNKQKYKRMIKRKELEHAA